MESRVSEKFTHGLVYELKPTCNSRTGFSLIELLVVIAIVALLASMILPGLARAREYAYFTVCKSNLRQIAIGCISYTAANRGRFPEGQSRCTGTPSAWRKTGGMGCVTSYNNQAGKYLVTQLVEGPRTGGLDWSGATGYLSRWVGEPRTAGLYLNVEIFWCPIVKNRNWNFSWLDQYGWAGTEQERDKIVRYLGNFGYALFLHEVGCAQYRSSRASGHVYPAYAAEYGVAADGDSWRAEEPCRWNTNSRAVNSSHKPSVWLGADWVVGRKSWSGHDRTYVGHFGVGQTAEGKFRFNVAHLDGHVNDSFWKEPLTGSIGTQWRMPVADWGRPYGWPYIGKPLSAESIGGPTEKVPAIEGAFDEND